MEVKLKKINEQTIVVTGATSEIGLTTVRMAVERGAKLVLAARNEEALRKLVEEINSSGGEAVSVVADVGIQENVRRIADRAIEIFGGFDTWVNNAGVSIYGKIADIPFEDQRRLFETNYWGVVYGSLAAVDHLKQRGGALINIGSILSDRAIPLQGPYCASKHAVKGFTDALRMELEDDDAPISVTLIKPGAIDTPYKDHAKNYLGVKAENPPPVYAPDAVAGAILHCAENPVRDVFVGAPGKAFSLFSESAPGVTDKLMEATLIDWQQTDKAADNYLTEGLYESQDSSMRERGGYSGYVSERSLYTKVSLHPVITGAAVALGVGLAYRLINRSPKKA